MCVGKYLVLIDFEWGEVVKQVIVDEMCLEVLVSEYLFEGVLVGLCLVLDFECSVMCWFDCVVYSYMILFILGIIGQLKGIEFSQQVMFYVYCIGCDCLGIGEYMCFGCFYWISGLGIFGINFFFLLLYGGSVVFLLLYCWVDSEGFWECVECFGISFFYLVLLVVNYMVKEGFLLLCCLLLQCLFCVVGLVCLDVDLQVVFQCDYVVLVNIYGFSECGFVFFFGKCCGDVFDNLVGFVVGLEFKLIDFDGCLLEGSGECGCLWVCMLSLFFGYVNCFDLIVQVFEDGWLNIQDFVYFDEDCCVYVFGCCDGIINKGGNLFYLNECERVFNGLDEVIDVCCLKVDCLFYGEDYVVVIYIVLQVEFVFLFWFQQQFGIFCVLQCVVLLYQVLLLNGVGKYDCCVFVVLL